MYTGWKELVLENEQSTADFYEGKLTLDLRTNQYLLVKNSAGEIIDKKKFNGENLEKINYFKIKDFKPKSFKQEFLCDALCDLDIPIRLIGGVAGSGKSSYAIKYGFHFISKGKFQKIFLLRHNVSVGEKNGYLPGNKWEKVKAWLGFFEDNLDSQYTIDDLVSNGMLEVDTVESMKGRDLKDSWIMVDEAEDLTVEQFKMIGERVSSGSVINFLGDYYQTTGEKYAKNSGLLRSFETLAGNPKTSIIVFDDKENDNVRSEVSKIFSYLY